MAREAIYYSLNDVRSAMDSLSDRNLRIFRVESLKTWPIQFNSQEELDEYKKSNPKVDITKNGNEFSVSKSMNYFKLFDSLQGFLDFSVSNPDVCLHELITGKNPHHVYFDIDYTFNQENQNYLMDEYNYGYAVTNAIYDRLSELGINFVPLVYGSSSTHKISLHIVFPQLFVQNNLLNKALCTHLGNSIPPAYAKYIDFSVYSTNHSLRAPCQTKPGQNRTKRLVSWLPTYGFSELDGFIVGWNDLGRDVSEIAARFAPIFSSIVCDSLFAPILELIYKMETDTCPNINFPEGRYGEGKLTKNPDGREIWAIMRKIECYCVICCREHTNEHMYVIITEKEKRFYCRRADQEAGERKRYKVLERSVERFQMPDDFDWDREEEIIRNNDAFDFSHDPLNDVIRAR